jgi:hypothetical protein
MLCLPPIQPGGDLPITADVRRSSGNSPRMDLTWCRCHKKYAMASSIRPLNSELKYGL